MQTSALKASENMCHSSCIPPLLLAALCLYLEVYAITFCAKAGSRRINQTQNALLSNHTTFLLSNNFQKFDLEKRCLPPNGDLDMAFIAPGGKIALSFSICAKFGSTSIYKAFLESVYGHEFNATGRPPCPGFKRGWNGQNPVAQQGLSCYMYRSARPLFSFRSAFVFALDPPVRRPSFFFGGIVPRSGELAVGK